MFYIVVTSPNFDHARRFFPLPWSKFLHRMASVARGTLTEGCWRTGNLFLWKERVTSPIFPAGHCCDFSEPTCFNVKSLSLLRFQGNKTDPELNRNYDAMPQVMIELRRYTNRGGLPSARLHRIGMPQALSVLEAVKNTPPLHNKSLQIDLCGRHQLRRTTKKGEERGRLMCPQSPSTGLCPDSKRKVSTPSHFK